MNNRIILVNIYYSPRRFGGATIVVEEMAKHLKQMGWDVLIVTTHEGAQQTFRYRANGTDVISLNGISLNVMNKQMADNFESVIDSYMPDLVHFHSIQMMGLDIIERVSKKNIPYAVTLHDHWWLCDRQFMITPKSTYCFQDVVSLDVCEKKCNIDKSLVTRRNDYAQGLLMDADRLFFPSQYFTDFYIANGFPSKMCLTNKNGIKWPDQGYKKKPIDSSKHSVRFGFLGGPGPIKGFDLIVKAFSEIKTEAYELVLVDAAQNLQKTWYPEEPIINGKVTIVPGYTQDTIDDFFSTIDVLLFPSQWKESFGLTVREALSRDVWVISTNVGGVAEDLFDGINSDLIPLNGNHTELKDKIESCIRKDWTNYVNPLKAKVRDFQSQTIELSEYYKDILSSKEINNV